MSLPSHSRELTDYGSVLRRRWPLFVTLLIAGVAGGAALLVRTPPQYSAVAQVQVLATGVQDQLNPVTSRQREPLNLDTESQIARSVVVAQIAARGLKYRDPEELRERVHVDVPPNSAILSISFTASTPESAAAGAQAFADAYLRNRTRAAGAALDAEIKLVAAKLRQVDAELDPPAATAGGTPGTPAGGTTAGGAAARTVTSRHQAVLTRQESALTLRYDALKTVVVTPGTVISPARPPSAPSSPSAPIYLGSGLFLGLLAGAGAAFCRDRLDTRIRRPGDVERLTGLPVLAEPPSRPEPAIFHELAAAVATALGEGRHTLLVEAVGAAGAARPLAKGLCAAFGHFAPVSVVTGRADRPDSALLLAALRRTRSPQVARAVRQLRRQGVRVLGVVAVPPGITVPAPEPVERTA